MLTKELTNTLFTYDDGILRWKVSLSNRASIGMAAGTVSSTGYLYVRVSGVAYLVHRVIFLMHHGYLPEQLDHIDGDKRNNRIENLRAATHAENQRNKSLQQNSTSKIKNVSWWKKCGKWRVQIKLNGAKKHIGSYHDIELAELVAIEARNKYHGKFANHG